MVGRTLRLPVALMARVFQATDPEVPLRLTLPGAFAAFPPGCDQSASASAPPIEGVPPTTSSVARGKTDRRSPGRISSFEPNGLRLLRALQPPIRLVKSPTARQEVR